MAAPGRDLLKLAVVNRYERAAPPAVCFVRGFGLARGALAGSVAHDSHNVLAVGADDASLAAAVNAVVAQRGGLAAVDGDRVEVLPLPVAGLMSLDPVEEVAARYLELDAMAELMGSSLAAPFMTLSFMALLVIPSLKLSDRGVVRWGQLLVHGSGRWGVRRVRAALPLDHGGDRGRGGGRAGRRQKAADPAPLPALSPPPSLSPPCLSEALPRRPPTDQEPR